MYTDREDAGCSTLGRVARKTLGERPEFFEL